MTIDVDAPSSPNKHTNKPTAHNWHEKHKLQYKICEVINRAKIPKMPYFQSHLDVASNTGSSISCQTF